MEGDDNVVVQAVIEETKRGEAPKDFWEALHRWAHVKKNCLYAVLAILIIILYKLDQSLVTTGLRETLQYVLNKRLNISSDVDDKNTI